MWTKRQVAHVGASFECAEPVKAFLYGADVAQRCEGSDLQLLKWQGGLFRRG
jgi:hypothetical protein